MLDEDEEGERRTIKVDGDLTAATLMMMLVLTAKVRNEMINVVNVVCTGWQEASTRALIQAATPRETTIDYEMLLMLFKLNLNLNI